MKKIKWKIRNILADGTVLGPNEPLPNTPEVQAALWDVLEIAQKSISPGLMCDDNSEPAENKVVSA